MGRDGIPSEAWKYGREEVERWIWETAEKGKGDGSTMYIDLKAAFDSVDRGVLIEGIRERGIREELVERVDEILRETKSRVRIGKQWGEKFWIIKGVRQGYPLSPMLFNILIADIDKDMEKGRWGRLKLKDRRIYTLMYADDIVVMAEEEHGMKALVSRMERYLDRMGLELNVEKTKVMSLGKEEEEKEIRLKVEREKNRRRGKGV
ncbi:rna-directed dna polymerase reverse transcriptase domain containing protein [Lasius niger]|uniref:Rna-directed dna polymerase reverse transcriptase domain containing protein n=1 Tax=Lasius niger TaxID=67767 RepID=A0A0J7K1H7_LASNI|nr:rna-directed dna polymerase reverse transcriptase domain containing protein [Lasius niger]